MSLVAVEWAFDPEFFSRILQKKFTLVLYPEHCAVLSLCCHFRGMGYFSDLPFQDRLSFFTTICSFRVIFNQTFIDYSFEVGKFSDVFGICCFMMRKKIVPRNPNFFKIASDQNMLIHSQWNRYQLVELIKHNISTKTGQNSSKRFRVMGEKLISENLSPPYCSPNRKYAWVDTSTIR